MLRFAGLLILGWCVIGSTLAAEEAKVPTIAEGQESAPLPGAADRPVASLKASLSRTEGEIPQNRAAQRLEPAGIVQAQFDRRAWVASCCEWESPATKHLPLLFEETNLERMGYLDSCTLSPFEDEECVWTEECLQPISSGLQFFGNAAIIPYRAGYQSLCEPVYTLGHDRPGSPVCYRKHHLPLSLRGAAYQTGFVTGLVFFIP